MTALESGPKTPTQLASIIKRRPNHVSFYLKGLAEMGLVVSLDPAARKGRLYVRTQTAIEAMRLLNLKH